ncbi:hypothetical protein CRE_25624 [Caenorhabditis remanei]|uniref:Uncharacterized protein n=1 Tax=Caenorhabditis remanei TaxID=31234 RepID=E3ML30_CAERE|nr:hypothetical protein CRE_25624 [Caenorhabditis remanei]
MVEKSEDSKKRGRSSSSSSSSKAAHQAPSLQAPPRHHVLDLQSAVDEWYNVKADRKIMRHFLRLRYKFMQFFLEGIASSQRFGQGTNDNQRIVLEVIRHLLDSDYTCYSFSHVDMPASATLSGYRKQEYKKSVVSVIHVASLPINSSGKVDENELRRISNNHFTKDTSSIIQEFLKKRLGIDLENVLGQSFVSIGVNSLIAAELSISFGEIQEVAKREILNDKITIRSFLNKFESEKLKELNHEESETIKVKVLKRRQPRMNWISVNSLMGIF